MSELASLIPTPEQLLAQQIAQFKRFASQENKERESRYWVSLYNWKLNAPIQQAMGLKIGPKPQPERLVLVDYDASGAPVLKSGADPVVTPEVEPAPVAPGLTVVIGDLIPGLNGFRAVGPGDTAPIGYRSELAGKGYVKTAMSWATFGGIKQCFYVPE